MSAALVGIDLGTTHTLVSVLTPSGPEVLRGALGEQLIPSAVAVDEDGVLLVGATAAERLSRQPEAGVRAFKREMGTERTWTLGEHVLDATALSALLLREAREVAEQALGEPVTRAVITVPAYFQEPQRSATLEAGQLAGLQVERLVNEPTAAAMAHGLHDAETERRCAVVDLGGGTLDITLLDIFDGVVEVIATSGDARLGGEDFTDALLEHAAREAGLSAGPGSPTLAILREECERVKRALGEQDFERLTLPEPDPERWRAARSVSITERALRELCAPLLRRLQSCIEDALSAGGVDPQSVEELLLVGGGTRVPAVARVAQALFPNARVFDTNPDLAVSLGAAVQGGLIDGDEAVRDLVVTDVLGHSLGVEISRRGQDRLLTGYFEPILSRSVTLPTRRVHRVWTLHHRQKSVKVRVFQGEARFVSENRLLGELTLEGLKPLEDPEACHGIDIAFTHDLNGLLEVEVTQVDGGEAASLLIERRPGRMSEEARDRAVAALARLKVHPRDLLPNRLLLEQAHALHVRLNEAERGLLDMALFPFEEALERQDSEEIALTAAALRRVMERLRRPPTSELS